ncbi:MAG: phosphatidylglycerophosphatase A [Alphaproteobacteria bacterium]|jgi:phosphatidylglycerophosphatase A|nr:phosphatidylglycerophosphatase A [Alphaproteobacteria bacterium]
MLTFKSAKSILHVGGIGLIPKAPGTWGSLAGLLSGAVIVALFGVWALLLCSLAAIALGLYAGKIVTSHEPMDDPSWFVLDEVIGMWLVLLVTPFSLFGYALAFALFRVFDIFKPWPVSWADRRVKGTFGILLDDILAAMYAGALILLLL